jgi:hypothetical protein
VANRADVDERAAAELQLALDADLDFLSLIGGKTR